MDMGFWEWVYFLTQEYGTVFLSGAGVALFLAVMGTFLGTLIGSLGSILATIPSLPEDRRIKKMTLRSVRCLISFYVWLFRGTPMMVQAMVIYYGASALFQWDLNPISAGLSSFPSIPAPTWWKPCAEAFNPWIPVKWKGQRP